MHLYPDSLMLAHPHRSCETNGRQAPPLSRSRPRSRLRLLLKSAWTYYYRTLIRSLSRKSVIPSLLSVRFPSYFIHQNTSLSFIWRELVIYHVSSRKQRVPTQPGLGGRHPLHRMEDTKQMLKEMFDEFCHLQRAIPPPRPAEIHIYKCNDGLYYAQRRRAE